MTSVLFVDDEARVLSGLRRLLHPRKREWKMEFVASASAALERMAESPFDVIVSDMRMPGMDGAQLLSAVRDRYPSTVRIVLSGQSGQEEAMRAVGPAHQYLSKPCDPEILISTVSRACALRSRLEQESLKQVVTQLSALPSLPAVYQKLVDELKSDDGAIDNVAELISQDAAMTAKLLQLVNSSFFGVRRRVESPAVAASLLGMNLLRTLVLSVGVFSQFDQSQMADFPLNTVMAHSLAVSMAAREIAEREPDIDARIVEEAMLAGVLHDVGKLVLAANLSADYRETLRRVDLEQIPLWRAEIDQFGASHADIGGYLLDLWGLPGPVAEAVAFHHEPSKCEGQFSALSAVHVANVMHNQAQDDNPIGSSERFDLDYLNRLNAAPRLDGWRATFNQSRATGT